MPTPVRLRFLLCIIALAAIALIPQAAFSQRLMWPDAPRDIQIGSWFLSAIPDGVGGSVFALARPGANYTSEYVLQRVDNTGKKLWGNGVVIPGADYIPDYCLAGDEKNGFFVLSTTHDDHYNYSIWVRKVTKTGRLQWTTMLTRKSTNQYLQGTKPTVMSDGSLVVLFMDRASNDSEAFKMQRLASSGHRVYGDSGVTIGKGLPGQYPMACTVDTKGNVYAAWRLGYEDMNFAVRCFDTKGKLRWTRPLPAYYCSGEGYFSETVSGVKLATDDQGGLVCLWYYGVWEDWFNGYRMQRFSALGKPMWGTDGIVPFAKLGFTFARRFELIPCKGGFYAWTAAPLSDIYLQKYDLSGRALWKQDVRVCGYPFPESNETQSPGYTLRPPSQVDAAMDKDSSVIFSWYDSRNWDSATIPGCSASTYVQKVSSSGLTRWTTNGFNVPNAPTYPSFTGVDLPVRGAVPDGQGGLLILGFREGPAVVMQRIVPADGPPSTPSILTEGWFTYSLDSLSAQLASVDAKNGITEYEYALRTDTYGDPDVIPWTSNGPSSQINLTGLSLSANSTYHIFARAKNGIGLWSTCGRSEGILPVQTTSTIAEALALPMGWRVLPPPFTIVEVDGDRWRVEEYPGGPLYNVSGYSTGKPGDIITAVCRVYPASADDDGWLDVAHILEDN